MLVIGIAGKELSAEERDWLQHPGCAGVILFTRNFASKEQVVELTQAIRAAARISPASSLTCAFEAKLRVNRMTPAQPGCCSHSRSSADNVVPAMPITSISRPP